MCRGSVSLELGVSLREARVGFVCGERPSVAGVLVLKVTRCIVVAVYCASISRRRVSEVAVVVWVT